jgi:hypothetical protein
LNVHVEVTHEVLDNDALLRVLLPEEDGVWAHDVEELAHHSRNSCGDGGGAVKRVDI